MVLEKQIDELLLMAPLHLVVVLHSVRLVGSALRRRALCHKRHCKGNSQDHQYNCKKRSAHSASRKCWLPFYRPPARTRIHAPFKPSLESKWAQESFPNVSEDSVHYRRKSRTWFSDST